MQSLLKSMQSCTQFLHVPAMTCLIYHHLGTIQFTTSRSRPYPPLPIVVDESAPTPEKVKNPVWIKSLQLFKSDQDVLIHGKELTDAPIAAQKLLSKKYLCINGLQSPCLAPLLQFNPTSTRAVQIHHTGKPA